MHFLLVALFLVFLSSNPALAQAPESGAAASSARAATSVVIDGPSPSDQPNVMVRDADFKSTIRAIKLRAPLKFDGRLDDEVYAQYPGFGGMLQVSPRYNQPSTEKTEIWVMFDGDNIYIAARCWDQAPPERWIANELRRDTNQMRQNDHFGVGFDTFYDRRSGYMFYANPLGGMLTAWSDVLIAGANPEPWSLVMAVAWSFGIFIAGGLFFVSREREFAVRL